MSKMSRNNLGYPVRIVSDTGGLGTGFYVCKDSVIYLVTAKHVLFDTSNNLLAGTCLARSYSEEWVEGDFTELKIDLKLMLQNGNLKYHETQDACVIKLAIAAGEKVFPLGMQDREVSVLQKNEYGIVHMDYEQCPKRFDEVGLANDVYMMGYPASIGVFVQQFNPEMPLLRKGIVAGKWNEKKSIIVDCPSYPGNSGGPIIEVDHIDGRPHYKLIGLVSQLVGVDEKWTNPQAPSGTEWARITHSGYSVVVPFDFVDELID